MPFGPVTVKVRVTGTTDAPRVELIDLGATARSLLGAVAHGIGKKVERALGK